MGLEAKHKHLDYIQATITRMANNSFLIKGWAVTLVAAILAFTAKDGRLLFMPVALVPIVPFWWLDAYFLNQERLFRALYDSVRGKKEEEIDYSMDTSSFAGNKLTIEDAAKSFTLKIFYIGTIAVVLVSVDVYYVLAMKIKVQ